MNKNLTQDTKSALDIRIEFRDYFGIDLMEAESILKEMKENTERTWHQVLVSNRII